MIDRRTASSSSAAATLRAHERDWTNIVFVGSAHLIALAGVAWLAAGARAPLIAVEKNP